MSVVILVLEPERPVAQDLSDSLRAIVPRSCVLTAASEDEALALLDAGPVPTAAILHAEPARVHATPLGQALRRHGIPVLFTGPLAELDPRGAPVLPMPFSDASLSAALAPILPGNPN